MGRSQKLNQLLRKILSKSLRTDELQISAFSGSSRRVSFSSAGSASRASSQRSMTWNSASRCLSMTSTADSEPNNNSSGNFDTDCDCEDEDCWSSTPPQGVPAGCLPVYVGEERRRFVIPTSYLTDSTFQELLAKSEEEYGLRCEGGLRIACSPDAFEAHLLRSLQGFKITLNESGAELQRSFSHRLRSGAELGTGHGFSVGVEISR